jgi:D-glycero-D-manno-heptose 1,7-bisphosphate phosphatase
MNKAAFLDRDGVINRNAPIGEYITRWEEVKFLPGVAEAIRRLHEAGFLVVVVTNQRCVARGLTTAAEVESLHARMKNALALEGAKIDAVYYCPHEYEPPCDCRKPKPGMLLRAAREHDIDLNASWMIGDSDIDVEAGRNAKCRTVRILREHEVVREAHGLVAFTLLEAVLQGPVAPANGSGRGDLFTFSKTEAFRP